jgi:hypothetical protein
MIDPADISGLALAALALATASLADDVSHGQLPLDELHAIFADARTLVHDPAGFVVDAATSQAADDFLSVAEALADPMAIRITENTRRVGLA